MRGWPAAVEHFIEDDPQGPDVYFVGEDGVGGGEGLGWEVVVGAHPLGGQGHFGVLVVDDFADAEVQYFEDAVLEDNVLRLEVVMHNALGRQVADH